MTEEQELIETEKNARVEKKDRESSAVRIDFDEGTTWLSRSIYIILAVLMIFSVVAFGAVDVWMIGVNSVLSSLIVIFWCIDSFKNREVKFNTNFLQIPFLGLIALGLIQLLPIGNSGNASEIVSISPSSTLTLNPYLTRLFVIQLVIAFIFFAASLTFINNRKRFQSVSLTIIVFGSIMALFGILQYLVNPESIYGLRDSKQAIPFASFFNRHHFAAFMEMTIGLTLGLLFGDATKQNKKIFFIIAAVVMGMAILLTGSRGGIISLLCVIGFVMFWNFFKNREIKDMDADEDVKRFFLTRNLVLFGGGLALIAFLFLGVLFIGGDQSLLRGFGLAGVEGDVTTGRSHFWRIALQIFFAHPIIGAGFDAFGVAFTRYDTWSGAFRIEQAHNDYLQILADGGIIGFSCVAAFIVLLFKQGIKTIRTHTDKFVMNGSIGALAGCFGILIHSFFDFPLRTPSNVFFFLMLVTLSVVPLHFRTVQRRRIKVFDQQF